MIDEQILFITLDVAALDGSRLNGIEQRADSVAGAEQRIDNLATDGWGVTPPASEQQLRDVGSVELSQRIGGSDLQLRVDLRLQQTGERFARGGRIAEAENPRGGEAITGRLVGIRGGDDVRLKEIGNERLGGVVCFALDQQLGDGAAAAAQAFADGRQDG